MLLDLFNLLNLCFGFDLVRLIGASAVLSRFLGQPLCVADLFGGVTFRISLYSKSFCLWLLVG